MTQEQIQALEYFIRAVIDDHDRSASTFEAVQLMKERERLERAFGLRD